MCGIRGGVQSHRTSVYWRTYALWFIAALLLFRAGKIQKRPALGDVSSQGQAGNFRTPAVPPCLPPKKAASLRDASTSLLCNGSSPARDTAPARRFPLPSTVHLPPRFLPVSILRALWKCAVRCDLRLNGLQTFNTISPGLSRAYHPKNSRSARRFSAQRLFCKKISHFFVHCANFARRMWKFCYR